MAGWHTKPLPAGAGRFAAMLLDILKYDIVGDIAAGRAGISACPEVPSPVALLQGRELRVKTRTSSRTTSRGLLQHQPKNPSLEISDFINKIWHQRHFIALFRQSSAPFRTNEEIVAVIVVRCANNICNTAGFDVISKA